MHEKLINKLAVLEATAEAIKDSCYEIRVELERVYASAPPKGVNDGNKTKVSAAIAQVRINRLKSITKRRE